MVKNQEEYIKDHIIISTAEEYMKTWLIICGANNITIMINKI